MGETSILLARKAWGNGENLPDADSGTGDDHFFADGKID